MRILRGVLALWPLLVSSICLAQTVPTQPAAILGPDFQDRKLVSSDDEILLPDGDIETDHLAWDKMRAGHYNDAEDLLKGQLKDHSYDLRLQATLFDVYVGAHRLEDGNRLLKHYFEVPGLCVTALRIDQDFAQPYGQARRVNRLAPVILRGICVEAALDRTWDDARRHYCEYYLGKYFGQLELNGISPPVKLPNNSLEVSMLAVGAEDACHGELTKARFYFTLAKQKFPKSKMAIAAFQGLGAAKAQ